MKQTWMTTVELDHALLRCIAFVFFDYYLPNSIGIRVAGRHIMHGQRGKCEGQGRTAGTMPSSEAGRRSGVCDRTVMEKVQFTLFKYSQSLDDLLNYNLIQFTL